MQPSNLSIERIFALTFLLMTCCAQAQTVVRLWPGVAPGSEHWTQKEVVTHNTPVGTVVINVVTPVTTQPWDEA